MAVEKKNASRFTKKEPYLWLQMNAEVSHHDCLSDSSKEDKTKHLGNNIVYSLQQVLNLDRSINR